MSQPVRVSRAAAPAVPPLRRPAAPAPPLPSRPVPTPDALEALRAFRARELEVEIEPRTGVLWCWMRPEGAPSYTASMLREMIELRGLIQAANRIPGTGSAPAVRYVVAGSRIPGTFNLGGDLGLFVDLIQTGDREALQRYAHDCVEVQYQLAAGLETGVVTVALVQGDALGGGFEGVLACHVSVAERSAKFGFPEILFNLFPGMGAHSFLSRKVEGARALDMILSGETYRAADLHAMGLIDILAEDGAGEEAVRAFIAGSQARYNAKSAFYRARHNAQRLTLGELRAITDLWVDAAFRLSEADLRRMQRLRGAQARRLAGPSPAASGEAA